MSVSSGTQLGAYEILATIGAGGMGEVYRARDTRLGREAAIKILPAALAENQDRLKRFEREARTASSLNHPNIVTIYDIGSVDSQTYIAMELIDGKTLRSVGTLSPPKILNIASQIADGLAKAHAAGIVHRDLKPENIMITKDGFVKILDFGLAKLTSAGSDPSSQMLTQSETETKAGTVLGTVGYMSPEQAAGEALDFRSDQFSFGTILYELISGKHPFRRKTSAETLTAILNEQPASLTETPAPLSWIIERCLSKDPNERYESTRDLTKDLINARDHFSKSVTSTAIQPIGRKNIWKIWGVAASILTLLLATILLIVYNRSQAKNDHSPISYHRLSYRRGSISTAAFAPDGQTIVYSAAFEGRPRELYLTRSEGIESQPLGIMNADILSISPKGQMLILLHEEKAETAGFWTGVLAMAPLSGGGVRELTDGVAAACWSPDGSKIAVVRKVANRSRLEFPLGKVLYETTKIIRRPRFSADGTYIAFGKFPHDSTTIINLKGKTIAQSGPAWPEGIVWRPESNEVWFTTYGSEGGSGSELRSLKLTGGERLLQRFPLLTSLEDVTKDGRILMTFNQENRLAVAGVHQEERNLSWLDDSRIVGLSEDGKSIAIYESGEASEAPMGSTYFRKTDGSPAVHLGAGVAVDMSRDGKYVLSYLPDPFRFVLFPTGAGETKSLKIEPLSVLGDNGQLTPDGKQIIFSANDVSHGYRVFSQLITGGQPRPLTAEGVRFLSRTISPDGKLFFGQKEDDQIFSFPLSGNGAETPITAIEKNDVPIQWSIDGVSIYVFRRAGAAVEIFSINTRNGKRTFVKKLAPLDPAGVSLIDSVRMTPDGKTFAYSYGHTLSTLYLMTGVK